MRNTPHNRIAVSRPTTAPTPKWFHSDLNIWFILYVDCSNIVQSIRELRVRRYALFVAAFPFGAERIQSQSHYQPALSSFLFFFLSQHFPSVERVCAFCSALWDANFTASSSDLHRPSLWARWRQQQRRFRGSMDFCSVPISWYPYNRALYIVARLGSINVLCICIYIAHECVYSFPLLSLSIRGAGIDAVKCAVREEKERPETRCVSTAAERASLINCCWSLES